MNSFGFLTGQAARQVVEEPVFEPNFLNLEYIFNLLIVFTERVFNGIGRLFSASFGIPETPELMALRIALWALVATLAGGLLYVLYKDSRLSKEQYEKLQEKQRQGAEEFSGKERNTRWMRALDLLDSPEESDWRVAIMEADVMLSELLDSLGYIGDTVGDKLKAADPAEFRSLDAAWKAHRTRNWIAHEGTAHRISKREARQAIDSFEQVFEEFGYI